MRTAGSDQSTGPSVFKISGGARPGLGPEESRPPPRGKLLHDVEEERRAALGKMVSTSGWWHRARPER